MLIAHRKAGEVQESICNWLVFTLRYFRRKARDMEHDTYGEREISARLGA